jgi:murein DD-endopeptidase MepM/ murein hydrolase activator NlpD
MTLRRVLTGGGPRWDHAPVDAPRHGRGGGWRKSGLRATVVALVGLALFVGQQIPAAADDPLAEAMRRKEALARAVAVSRQNAERYKQAANQFEAAVSSANARIADLAQKRAVAQSEAESLGYEIQITEEQLALVAFQLDETKALAESLTAQAAEQQRQLVQREDLYAKHLVATYRQALISPLEMLLSSKTLTEFANRVQQMIFVNRQDQQLANEIRGLRAGTAAKLDEAAGKQNEILGLQDQIASQRKSLSEQKSKYEQLVAQMQTAIQQQADARADAATNKAQAIGALGAANRETMDLNRRLEEAERQYANLAAQLAAKSGLGAFNGAKLATWPVSGPITSGFGARWGGFHNGLDIAAPKFTPLRAASSGQVVTVGRPYMAYGDTAVVVIIAHGYNFSTLYGHLDDSRWPPVRVGQFVGAGAVIGYVGMTGWTTGPHVHFMTIVNGQAVNPRPYLP